MLIHLPKISVLIALAFAVSAQAQQPAQTQGPHRYATGEYRLVKEGNTVSLFLRNSTAPIPVTMTAPNMYVSNAGVIYNEVPGRGLYETSMGVDMSAFSPEAVAASEAKRQRQSNSVEPDPVSVPATPIQVSTSRYYPVHDFAYDSRFGSNIVAVLDFNGQRIPVHGLNEKSGIDPDEINGHPRWYRAQSDLLLGRGPQPDTGFYGIKNDGNGWRVEKYDALPAEVHLAPQPGTITRDGFGRPHPQQ